MSSAEPPQQVAATGNARVVTTTKWVAPLWGVVVLFAVVTFVRSRQVDLPMRDPGGTVFTLRLATSLALFAVLVVVDSSVRAARRGWSVARVRQVMHRRWTRERIVLVVSGLVAYHVVYACYRNLKSWVAFRDVHDRGLLSLDRDVMGGHSPAVLLHDLLGKDAAAHVLHVVYESFSWIVPVSFVAALVLVPKIKEGYVFLASAMWVWILGVGTYYLVPSLGPFASAPGEFEGLARTGITETQEKYLAQRAHLLADPHAHDAFASISAFASLHVGFTCMMLLMLRYYGFRRATRVFAVYLAVVMVATVYLGWHFLVDLPAGVAVACLAVWLGRATIRPPWRSA
jgi:hypothetical protein